MASTKPQPDSTQITSGNLPQDVSINELIELALATPEIGAVNFNILRILLHEMTKKLGISEDKAHLDQTALQQIHYVKEYIHEHGPSFTGQIPELQLPSDLPQDHPFMAPVHHQAHLIGGKGRRGRKGFEMHEDESDLGGPQGIASETASRGGYGGPGQKQRPPRQLPSRKGLQVQREQDVQGKYPATTTPKGKRDEEGAEIESTTRDTIDGTGTRGTKQKMPGKTNEMDGKSGVSVDDKSIAPTCGGPGVCPGPDSCPICYGDALHKGGQDEMTSKVKSVSGKPITTTSEGGCKDPSLCPGPDICTACRGDPSHPQKQGKGLAGKTTEVLYPVSDRTEGQLKELKSLIVLPKDLNDLRRRLRLLGKIPDKFDELEVLETLMTVWEAVNVLKNNEESMAVRMVKHEANMRKISPAMFDKLAKIPPEALDILANNVSGGGGGGGLLALLAGGGAGAGLFRGFKPGSEEMQLVFSHLNNLSIESNGLKEKLERIAEAIHEIDNVIVTKHMLVDAMSEKADKGEMNTKVSYDEFGSTMDEINTRLQNLLVEVFTKNETWRASIDTITEKINEKLDRAELGPLKSYFKSHFHTLEEKVHQLSKILEDPDPAGTRKKLLKDYNCLSCDRHTNISGLTNTPLLPLLGPISAGHTTASQRAFELYKLRVKEGQGRCGIASKNLVLIERQQRADAGLGGSSEMQFSDETLGESDLLNRLVNRYVGGSHTQISSANRVSAHHKRIAQINASNNEELGCEDDIGPEAKSSAVEFEENV